jgi:hypothetical protein
MNIAQRPLLLPEDLCARTEKKFGHLEDFLVLVLEELLRDDAAALDLNEQRLVDERLRELGYL